MRSFLLVLLTLGLLPLSFLHAKVGGDEVDVGLGVPSQSGAGIPQCPTYNEILQMCQNIHSCAGSPIATDAVPSVEATCFNQVNACVSEWQVARERCLARQQNARSGVGDESGMGDFPEPEQARPNRSSQPADRGSASRQETSGGENSDSGGNQQEASSDYSQSTLSSEVQQCVSNSQDAFKCCNNPAQCGVSSSSNGLLPPSSNDPEGIKRYCEQMKYANLSGRSSNGEAAGVCYSGHSTCSKTCSELKEKWQNYLPNCRRPNCDPQRVQQAINIFSTKMSECSGLVENERLLANQSTANYSDARASQLCAQQAGMDPASLAQQAAQQASQGQNGPDCSGENANSPECVDCSKYPNSPLCGGGHQNGGFNSDSGQKISESSAEGVGFSDFNTSGGGELGSQFPEINPVQPQAAQGKAIPNGGGGGIPGGNSAGGSGFEDGSGSAGSSAGGYNTDILNGERGGGGASGSGGAVADGSGGGFSGYGRGSNGFKSKYRGLDLKQYLPGGAKDPRRKIASAPKTIHPEIAPAGESLFKRISNRFTLMCKMKQFIGCE